MKYLLQVLLCAFSFSSLLFSSDAKPANYPQVLTHALQNFSQQGILHHNGKNFYYIKVADDYIHSLFTLLPKEDAWQKPPYFRRADAPGAHISVFYEAEARGLKKPITATGTTFSFSVERLVTVRLRDKELLLIQVQAPALLALRSQYGLSPKLQGHEFHITIAQRKAQSRLQK